MAKGDAVEDHESIVRALWEPFWDGEKATPSAFIDYEISVSRLAVLDYGQIVEIFCSDFNGTDPAGLRKVSATAQVTVGDVHVACKSNPAVAVRVQEDPTEACERFRANPSHAVVLAHAAGDPAAPRKLSRGQANEILKRCTYNRVV